MKKKFGFMHNSQLETGRGRDSLVVKITSTCHEFEPSTAEKLPSTAEKPPSTAEKPPCRGGRCTLNMTRLKHSQTLNIGVEWSGEQTPAQVSAS
ncbi:hypothetical protein TNCV_2364531 [Trichonephila clavipes]|nr:hypothetical protein TNCV_2364531 [Trichonephila clavipes]